MNYLELASLLSAEILVVLGALLVLSIDLGMQGAGREPGRRAVVVGVGVATCAASAAWLLGYAPAGSASGGMFVSDPLIRILKVLLLGLTAGTLLLSGGMRFTRHAGEYVAVVLMGGLGMMLVVSSENLLMMFLSLELTSLCLYGLAGFNKADARGTEAALKYFLFGGMSGALLLFGLSLVYGVTGSIEFARIAVFTPGAASPLLLAGLVLVFAGLGFKVAAAPFHFWAPDAYEGAPTPVAGFIGAGSKVAAFFLVAKFVLVSLGAQRGSAGWGHWASGWVPIVAVLAAASMVWGNLGALRQRNVKRLLAYSAVAHGGYTLTALVGMGGEPMPAVLFYAATYAVTALGAFGVVGLVESAAGGSDFEHFRGLARRSPGMALCLAVFVLSLAGIPPLAGFFGKLYLFVAALQGPSPMAMVWLVGLGAATTCVSFYYYLRLLKVVFVEAPGDGAWRLAGGVEAAAVIVAAALVVVAGCAPGTWLSPLHAALASL